MRGTSSYLDAEDAVAETYTIAWRRFSDVPPDEGALPWLYGVCRRVLLNRVTSPAPAVCHVGSRGSFGGAEAWSCVAATSVAFGQVQTPAGGDGVEMIDRGVRIPARHHRALAQAICVYWGDGTGEEGDAASGLEAALARFDPIAIGYDEQGALVAIERDACDESSTRCSASSRRSSNLATT